MKFPNLIIGIILLFLAATVYSSTDTVIIYINNSTNTGYRDELYVDTLYFDTNDWKTYECNISDFKRDSIRLITFGPHHHGEDTGGFYVKDISLYGPDTLLIEDFASYDPDTISGSGQQLGANDRYWEVTLAWDGSLVDAAVIQGGFKYMHCFYSNPLGGEVGSILHLTFTPDTKDWSQYSKICFTVRNNIPTGIVPKKKNSHSLKIPIYQLQRRGLFIALPAQCESADLCLYALSGRLLRKKSYKRDGSFFWQLPFIPNGAYILTVDDGANTFSDMVVIER